LAVTAYEVRFGAEFNDDMTDEESGTVCIVVEKSEVAVEMPPADDIALVSFHVKLVKPVIGCVVALRSLELVAIPCDARKYSGHVDIIAITEK
jgi:hypothetical protein